MKYRTLWPVLALIVGLQSAWAQQLTPEQQKIEELERKIEELDRRLRIAEAKTEGAPAPPAVVAVAPPVLAPAPVSQSAPANQTGSQRPTNAGVAAGTIPVSEANTVGLVTVGPRGFAVQSGAGAFLPKIG